MSVFFLGSNAFAVPSLKAIVELGLHPIVITKPDKPAKRGQKISGTDVKEAAQKLGLSIWQPASLNEMIEPIKKEKPELIVSIAYGGYIPPEILSIPKLGTINLHPSLLPKYRGAAPVERALMAGETETGVTVAYVTHEWDAGDLLAQEKASMDAEADAGSLLNELANQGAGLLKKTLPIVLSEKAKAVPQDSKKATYAPRIKENERLIDWTKSAGEIVNQIRGLSPHRAAQTTFRMKRLNIYKGKEIQASGKPGTVLSISSEGPVIAAKKNAVLLFSVKPENKNQMSGRDFVNGYAIKEKEQL